MFGSSNPFGQTSNSSFGSPSVFGQNNNNNANNSPFGQNPFGSPSPFGSQTGSSIFGGTSTGVFGTQASSPLGSTSVFGASSAPAFGSSAFGQKPAFGGFGSTTPQSSPFGSSFQQSQPAFGNSLFGSSAFGASSQPAFGATSTPAFGSASTPTFGNTGSAFGVSSSPVFGSSTPAFGATSSPSPFSFGSTPGFGQTQTTSAFGGQSSPFGAQSTTPAFGSPGFGQSQSQQRGGTRVTPFAQTPEADSGTGTQTAGKLESISAMPAYKEKSHEELRWEDYQLGDKGGPNPNPGQSNLFSSSPAFSQPSANPFSSTTSTNSFAPKTSTFGASTSNPFGSTPSPTPSLFGSTPAFGQTTSASLFGTPSTSTFGTSTSIFGTTQAQDQTSSFATGLNFGNSQPSPLFQSTTPSLGQTTSPFGQTAPAFGQSNAFGGNMFSSTPTTSTMGFNQTTPSLSTPFQSAQNTGGFGSSSIFGQNTFGQPSANQSATLVQQQQQQQQSITNPFGTLPAMPQMSIGRAGTAPSIQYGISSLPVVEKPAPMRISSVLTSRHLSQRRIRLPARKYHPKNDSPKVSFFIDEEDTATSTPKADALFIPRENPRALVIRPLDQKTKNISSPAQDNGEYTEFPSTTHLNGRSTDNGYRNHPENGFPKEQQQQTKPTHKSNGTHDDQSNPNPNPKPDSYITLNGHRAGEAAIVYEHGADIEALMPKLRHSDYYTRPKIQELAAKERAEPGFCRHVNDFVVGRHDFGSIKFFGETDVRRLELESLIQFNNREVIVYMDETKKPPAGQGLNKPAEVTLLNIKCFDKKTGKCFTEGSRVEKYKEMLRKKAEDQGAEFVSYDPVLGEWKFRVSHFSRYGLDDDDDDDVTV